MKYAHSLFITTTLSFALGCSVGSPRDINNEDDELFGAGGRDLTEFWISVPIPHSQNTKNLNFSMMRSKVERATGLTWAQWEQSKQTFGAPDYIENWHEDRFVSQQKLTRWRTMAMDICEELVAQDAGKGNRNYFTIVDPAENIDVTANPVKQQIDAMHQRMFLEKVSATDLQESLALLSELQAEDSSELAWQGLCVAYISSMRFLSY